MNTSFIINLLLEAQEFEESGFYKNTSTIEDFRVWMNEKSYKKQSPRFLSEKEKQKVFDLENEIAKQVILLGRFTKQMIRKGLSKFPTLANEEFTYLYRLMHEPMLTKMQLVEKNAHEKQSGMEIIRRLVANGLVAEFSDENDKRIKRLKVTAAGEKMFSNSIPDVTLTSKILSAKLEPEEKEILLGLLKKLNEFHFTVYQDHRSLNIQEINALIN